MATNPNPTTSQRPGFSLTGDNTGGWAFATDIGPAAQWRLSSSISLPTGSAVDKVKALQAYYFYYNEAGNLQGFDRPEDVGPAPRHLGLIAQELQAVEPSLVRTMDWLQPDAAGEGQGDYYWVDYDALYVLCLDAINELNARAEAAKVALGITPAETYPARATTSTTGTPKASNFQLSVTPTTGPEGSQSVWTLTADNAADGLMVGFKLMGSCNHKDITCADEAVKLFTIAEVEFEQTGTGEDGTVYPKFGEYSVPDMGWGNGIFTFSGGQAQVTLDYVLDNEAEGPETIEMTLVGPTSDDGDVPTGITATATVTDA